MKNYISTSIKLARFALLLVSLATLLAAAGQAQPLGSPRTYVLRLTSRIGISIWVTTAAT